MRFCSLTVCHFCFWQVSWSVEKIKPKAVLCGLLFLTGSRYDLSFGYEYKLFEDCHRGYIKRLLVGT